MTFSIIIPTCDRYAQLKKCLESIKQNLLKIECCKVEVLITDDGNDTFIPQLIKNEFSWVKWVNSSKKGPAANRNNGAVHAHGDWLIFIDDDCIADEDLLLAYSIGVEKNMGVEVFEGYIGVDRDKRSFIEESPVNMSGGFLWSCNFMISKHLFTEINGFDESFPYPAMEDVDLQYRLQKINKEIVFLSTAKVIHPWRMEQRILLKTKFRIESILFFLKKHPEMFSKLNSLYFLKLSKNYFVDLIKHTIKYRCRGFIKHLLVALTYLRFSFFLLYKQHRFGKV